MTKNSQTTELNDVELDDVAGGRTLMRLKNAAVIRDSVNTSSADALSAEQVTLGYTEVEWTY